MATDQQSPLAELRIAIVAAQEHRKQADALVRACVGVLLGRQFAQEQLRMMWAPSVFQLPLLAKSVAESRDYDGVIVLGALTKDRTDRYYMELPEVYRALMDVMTGFGIPMSVALVGAERMADVKHAAARTGDKNPGARAAQDMVTLLTT